MAAENVFSGKGSAEASACKISPFVLSIRSRSLAANAWLYSLLVTRPACFRNSSVAAPGPAPISRTCSPKSVPAKSHGITCFRVMRRQYDEAQNQFSNPFTETRPIRRARKAGAKQGATTNSFSARLSQARATFSYRRSARSAIGSNYGGARHELPMPRNDSSIGIAYARRAAMADRGPSRHFDPSNNQNNQLASRRLFVDQRHHVFWITLACGSSVRCDLFDSS
jgi:hypothetical protein